MRHLSLDHLTVADATPSRLAETAAATGFDGICLFLRPMDVLPDMPAFALIGDTPERRATRKAMRDGGLTLDLVYPFTLSGRTDVQAFEPALETAAWLGGRLANILCYDRDPARRVDRLDQLAELAQGYGIGLAIEFYLPSQVRSLSDARATIAALPGKGAGVTADLLHLVRSGHSPEAYCDLGAPEVRIAQLCDGPANIAPELVEWEAGIERKLPGTGTFDCRAFLRALAPDTPVSVEAPRQSALRAGLSMVARARAAMAAARSVMLPD